MRLTSISTRFNVASFGCLGYELDLKHLTRLEQLEVGDQIAFYKAHRRTLQYGRFYRGTTTKENKVYWQSVSPDRSNAVVGSFQPLAQAAEGNDRLPVMGLDEQTRYRLHTKSQRVFIRRFGGLINHLLPFTINPNGMLYRWIDQLIALYDCEETYEASGKTLIQGVSLNNQFIGTGYNLGIRMLGDFGSHLYEIEKVTLDK